MSTCHVPVKKQNVPLNNLKENVYSLKETVPELDSCSQFDLSVLIVNWAEIPASTQPKTRG